MAEVSSITKVNFFRGYGIYTSGPYAERLLSCRSLKPLIISDIYNRSDTLLCEKGGDFDVVFAKPASKNSFRLVR